MKIKSLIELDLVKWTQVHPGQCVVEDLDAVHHENDSSARFSFFPPSGDVAEVEVDNVEAVALVRTLVFPPLHLSRWFQSLHFPHLFFALGNFALTCSNVAKPVGLSILPPL